MKVTGGCVRVVTEIVRKVGTCTGGMRAMKEV